MLEHAGVDLLLDVGANVGQYAKLDLERQLAQEMSRLQAVQARGCAGYARTADYPSRLRNFSIARANMKIPMDQSTAA